MVVIEVGDWIRPQHVEKFCEVVAIGETTLTIDVDGKEKSYTKNIKWIKRKDPPLFTNNDRSKAYDYGVQDIFHNKWNNCNPYFPSSKEYEEWYNGWNETYKKALESGADAAYKRIGVTMNPYQKDTILYKCWDYAHFLTKYGSGI